MSEFERTESDALLKFA